MRTPPFKEDVKNLSLIGGSALAAVLVTAGFLGSQPDPVEVRYEVVRPLRVTVTEARRSPLVIEAPPVDATGADRLWGRVVTVSGQELEGFLRWDRNEGAWSDLLDADKRSGLSGSVISQSGIRFGHVARIEVLDGQHARLTLRSGEEVEFRGDATDLGTGLRALVVDDPARGSMELRWRDLDRVELGPAPADVRPREARLYGTLTTRGGEKFTGYVTWDVDEIYSSDVLDGDDETGRDLEVPFGAIRSIERHSSSAARVTLRSGESLVLRGSNDVDASNNGISVSDPGLGQVMVSWADFASVRFHIPAAEAGWDEFDGGDRLRGMVITASGEALTGAIRWDRDEAYGWEILDGDLRGAELSVELGKVKSIRKDGFGSVVTLRDGRTLRLDGSNDVDRGNRGIEVETRDGTRVVPWSDFVEARFEG